MLSSAMLVGVIIVPLLGAVLTPLVSGRGSKASGPWALAVMMLTTAIGGYLIWHVAQVGPFSAYPGGWKPPYGIELRFDEFSGIADGVDAGAVDVNEGGAFDEVVGDFVDQVGHGALQKML